MAWRRLPLDSHARACDNMRMRELDPVNSHADLYVNNYSKQQNEAFTAAFNAITEAFRAAMVAETPVGDAAVQELVRQHYEFCSQFWTPSRDAYKSLAMSYLLPSPYRDAYESVAIGLGKYHYDAIVLWADANLS